MATVIGVGMQMTANAAGMTKGLSDADKALQLLQKIVEQNQQSLQRFGAEATKTAGSLDKLTRDASTLSKIEIGRVLVDSFQAIGSAFTSAAQNVLTLAGNVSQSLDSFNDLSARTGIGVEQLQGYSLAAKLAGVDTAEFGSAVQKLSVSIGSATPGGELDKSLRAINLSVAELRELSPEQQFSAIGDAIGRLPTAADRAAASVAVFGKQGAALAPLFREGAASIEELRARAERLGIIVTEDQLSNIGQMNDGFDLVRATIEGIIGQVIGNLAPAVTDVTNQFLKFVEEWSGAQGEGGTGIANAITDVLLQGAEIFAGVFDQFAGQFSGFTGSLETASAVFQFVANAFTAVTESLRQVFNLFEMIGNGITLGFAKLLEAIGSWVSDDLQQYGADLANAASAELAKNQQEFLEAGANSFQAGLDAVGLGEGEASAAERGAGAATAYVQKFREQVEASQQPEVKVADNIDKTKERLISFLAEAGDGADAFFQQSAQTLETFAKMADEGALTADQIKIINGFAEELNGKLNTEIALRKKASEAASKQAEEDQKRIKELLKPSDAATKTESDLAAVYREQARVQEQLAAARSAAASAETDSARRRAQEEADAAAASIASLDQIEAKLQETKQAASQGFTDGFAKQFEDTEKALDSARVKAKEFGESGLRAATALGNGVAALQERARAGFLNKAEYDNELLRLQGFFDEQLKREQENRRAINENRIAANQRVEEFLRNGVQARAQAEIEANDAVAKRRQQALENVKALEERIATQRQSLQAAIEQKDIQAQRARAAELKELERAKVAEQKIAQNRQQQQRQQQQGFSQEQLAQREQFAKAQDEQYKQAMQQQQQLLEERAKAEQAEFQRQSARITELNTLGSRTVNTADIRTQEGAALVLGLAANAQDPALIEARTQTKQLQLIAQGISQAAANYFNSPVAIVGGARLG